MDLIDWIFYWIGRLLSMTSKRLGLPACELSDSGYAVLGFVATIVIVFCFFVFRNLGCTQ